FARKSVLLQENRLPFESRRRHNVWMPKRSSKKKTEEVLPRPAEDVPTEAAPEGKNPAAVTLGRLGGKKGGPARANKLTKEQRSEIAKKAARARWAKKKD